MRLRKCISSTAAILLLTVIAVAASLVAYMFVTGAIKTMTSGASSRPGILLKVEGYYHVGNVLKVMVRNIGDCRAGITAAYLIDATTQEVIAQYTYHTPVTIEPGSVVRIDVPFYKDLEPGAYTLKVVVEEGVEASLTLSVNEHIDPPSEVHTPPSKLAYQEFNDPEDVKEYSDDECNPGIHWHYSTQGNAEVAVENGVVRLTVAQAESSYISFWSPVKNWYSSGVITYWVMFEGEPSGGGDWWIVIGPRDKEGGQYPQLQWGIAKWMVDQGASTSSLYPHYDYNASIAPTDPWEAWNGSFSMSIPVGYWTYFKITWNSSGAFFYKPSGDCLQLLIDHPPFSDDDFVGVLVEIAHCEATMYIDSALVSEANNVTVTGSFLEDGWVVKVYRADDWSLVGSARVSGGSATIDLKHYPLPLNVYVLVYDGGELVYHSQLLTVYGGDVVEITSP